MKLATAAKKASELRELMAHTDGEDYTLQMNRLAKLKRDIEMEYRDARLTSNEWTLYSIVMG